VHEALDLCLGCKGCRRDCPTGIDMAAYKSHVLDQAYQGRIRPISHYSLGWLPRWGRLITRFPFFGTIANFAFAIPGVGAAIKFAAGVDTRRPMPRFCSTGSARATPSPSSRGARNERRGDPAVSVDQGLAGVKAGLLRRFAPRNDAAPGPWANLSEEQIDALPEVFIWVDSFTDAFESMGSGTGPLEALTQVIAAVGYRPTIIGDEACCGLTWITTGQHDGARNQLRNAAEVLANYAEKGPIIGMEPSCMAVWRSDAAELLPNDPNVSKVAGALKTLAEFLAAVPGYEPPSLGGHTIVAQPHCHHASVLGWKADQALLESTGAKVVTVGGCGGLAGNFGVERGHYEVSVKVYEHDLKLAIQP
jgi:Fe-S oxidoreductase